jgi:hypothetical protein
MTNQEKIIYDILCSDEQPPEGQHWEGFVTNKIVAALAQPEPEPVAWGVLDDDGQIDWTADYPFSDHPGWPNSAPLYTASPQREWVGLTDEELEFYTEELGQGELGRGVLRAVVDFLKEKNT